MPLIDTFVRGGSEVSPFALENHLADTGTAWSRITGVANSVAISPDGQIRPNIANGASAYLYVNAYTISENDYETVVDVIWYSTSNGHRAQPVIRWNGTTGVAGGLLSSASLTRLQLLSPITPYTSYATRNINAYMVDGRSYRIVTGCIGQFFYVGIQDLVTNKWMSPTAGFDSDFFSEGVSATISGAPATGNRIGVLSYGSSTSDTAGFPITVLSTQAPSYVPSTPSPIALTHACVNLSPGWRVAGGVAESINPGDYIRINFVGTELLLNFDNTKLTDLAVTPTVHCLVDGAQRSTVTLSAASSQVSLVSGLSRTSHSAMIRFVQAYQGNQTVNRWNAGTQNMLRILSFAASAPGAAPTGISSKKLMVYGDSITEGLALTASGHDSRQSYATHLASALGCEHIPVGFGSQGWDRPGAYNVPAFRDAWSFYYSGASRLVGGLLQPQPDYIVINHGTNDGLNTFNSATLQGHIQTTLAAIRAAAPLAIIFLVLPFGRFIQAELQAAFDAYVAGSGDTKIYFLDLGVNASIGLTSFSVGATEYGSDGIHPTAFNHGRLGTMLANRIFSVINTGATPAPTKRISAPRFFRR